MHGSSAVSTMESRAGGAGASNAWALDPPKPKEFIATNGVRPSKEGNGVSAVGILMRLTGSSGLGFWKWRLGGTACCSNTSIALMSAARPEADSK